MKFPNQKTRKLFQVLLDREAQMKTELRQLENQIEEFETTYFEKHWNQGNVVLGWPRVAAPPPPNNAPKIKLIAKDKPFSLSSATSRVNFDLDDIADKNLTPYPENRFQTTKKRKGKKGKGIIQTRKRLIRRRRR